MLNLLPISFFAVDKTHFFSIRGLIVPSKEKKKDKKSSLIRKLGRSRTGSIVSQSQSTPGLVGLLETMRVQLEVYFGPSARFFPPLFFCKVASCTLLIYTDLCFL